MMFVMLCLQMHGIYKCWGGGGVLMVGFFVERVNSVMRKTIKKEKV